MTTPPPVPVEGEEGAETDAAAPAFVQKHAGDRKKNQGKKKTHSGVSINTLRKALEKMVSSVWVDPQSKRALGVVHGLLQQQVTDGQDLKLTDGQEPEATAAPTVEVGAEAFGAMQ